MTRVDSLRAPSSGVLWACVLAVQAPSVAPPTGMLGGVLMGKVRDGIETGVKENLKRARERLAAS